MLHLSVVVVVVVVMVAVTLVGGWDGDEFCHLRAGLWNFFSLSSPLSEHSVNDSSLQVLLAVL